MENDKFGIKSVFKVILTAVLLFGSILVIILCRENKHNVELFNAATNIIYHGKVKYDSIVRVNTKYKYVILRDSIYRETGITIPSIVPNKYIDSMLYYGVKYNIPNKIQFRLVYHESGFDTTGVSSSGALGYYQFLPSSTKLIANACHCSSRFEQGCYLIRMCKDMGNTWENTLSLYSSGHINDKSNQTQGLIKHILYE